MKNFSNTFEKIEKQFWKNINIINTWVTVETFWGHTRKTTDDLKRNFDDIRTNFRKKFQNAYLNEISNNCPEKLKKLMGYGVEKI